MDEQHQQQRRSASWRAGLICCVFFAAGALTAGALLPPRGTASGRKDRPAEKGWLTGTTDEKLARIEKHLRGLDVAMAEIGYRYGELLVAGRERNWEYAQYQTEKIDLSLRLAVERRPKREKSARPFLDEDLPRVAGAVKKRDAAALDRALARLYDGCVQCHKSEKVLHFKGAVDRIREQATRTTAKPLDRDGR